MKGQTGGGVELSALKRGGAEQQSSEDAHNEAQAPALPPARRSPRGHWLWVAQYDALSRKTLLQLWGSPGSVLAFILTPVVLLVFLFGVRTVLIDSSISAPARFLPAAPSDPAAALTPRRCAIFDLREVESVNQRCTSLAFTPAVAPYTTIMERFARNSGFR
jgi:hypothetical protein